MTDMSAPWEKTRRKSGGPVERLAQNGAEGLGQARQEIGPVQGLDLAAGVFVIQFPELVQEVDDLQVFLIQHRAFLVRIAGDKFLNRAAAFLDAGPGAPQPA